MAVISPSRRLRRTPFSDGVEAAGVKSYTVYNRMLLPTMFESVQADYRHLKDHVQVWDVSVERQVELRGPDATRLMQMLTPRDLSKMAVGQCKYILITNADGGILNDPILLRLAENHFWISLADSDILLWAQGVAVHSGLDVTIREPDVSPLQLQGPKSGDVMKALFGESIMDLKYYWLRAVELDGIPLIVSRTGWSSELGYELYLQDGSRGDDLWEKIMAAGKQHKIAPTGPSQIRRVEAGIFSYFQDMRVTDNPFEIGMDRLVDLEMEADFVGKEALKKIKKEGIKRKLVGIEILGDPISKVVPPQYTPGYFVPDHWPIFDDKKEIGYVTSKCFSPRLKKNIGYAFIPIEYAKNDTEFEIRSPYANLKAKVVPLPFYDPKKRIPIK